MGRRRVPDSELVQDLDAVDAGPEGRRQDEHDGAIAQLVRLDVDVVDEDAGRRATQPRSPDDEPLVGRDRSLTPTFGLHALDHRTLERPRQHGPLEDGEGGGARLLALDEDDRALVGERQRVPGLKEHRPELG